MLCRPTRTTRSLSPVSVDEERLRVIFLVSDSRSSRLLVSVFLLSGRRRSELECHSLYAAVLTSIIGRSLGRKLLFMVGALGCMYDFTHISGLGRIYSFPLLTTRFLGTRWMIGVGIRKGHC